MRSKGPLAAAAALFVLGTVVGVLLTAFLPSVSGRVETGVTVLPSNGMPTVSTILRHNAVTAVLLAGGVVTLGTTTVLNLLVNGVVQGLLLARGLTVTDPVTVGLLFVPHAVFELPALLLAAAAGFRGPREFARYLRGSKQYLFTRQDLRDVLVLGALALGLLVVAACVERYVTLEFAQTLR
ncbi:MAG: stage II sporulation protein M [Halobaculum sp.]